MLKSLSAIVLLCYLIAASNAHLADKSLKIGLLYSDPLSDGWTLRHDIARGNLERHFLNLGFDVTAETCISCPRTTATARMLDWASRGFELIFVTSGVFAANAREFVGNYTGNYTKIVTWGAPSTGKSHLNIAQKNYQGYYLSGVTCGLMTKTNKIGFVGLEPSSNTPNIINAFYTGAKKVNPQVEVLASFTNKYYDPLLEERAGELLVSQYSVDCSLGTIDSSRAFEKRNLTSLGYSNDFRYLVGENVVVSILQEWRQLYINVSMQVLGMNGMTFNGGTYTGGLGTTLEVSDFSPLLPASVKSKIWEMRAAVMSGADQIFCGKYAKICRPDLFIGVEPNDSVCLTNVQVLSTPTFSNVVANPRNFTLADVTEDIFVPTSSGLGVAIYVVAAILVFMAILELADIVIYRNTTVYRPASPLFCVFVVIGCIFGFTSVFSWVGNPSFSVCQLRIWLAGIGFAISYGGIVVKNYRTWRIFGNPSLQVFAITNTDLILRGILPILIGELVILIIWTAVDPYVPRRDVSPLLEYYQFNKICSSQSAWPLGIFLAYNGLLLTAGALISFLTSKALSKVGGSSSGSKMSKGSGNSGDSRGGAMWTYRYRFVESKFIGLAIYTTVLIGFCALAVLLAVNYSIYVNAGITAFAVLIFFASVLGFVFFPKFKRTHINNEKELYTHKVAANSSPKSAAVHGGGSSAIQSMYASSERDVEKGQQKSKAAVSKASSAPDSADSDESTTSSSSTASSVEPDADHSDSDSTGSQ